ncbi:ADP-ribosylation factor 1-like [Fagus crenata]
MGNQHPSLPVLGQAISQLDGLARRDKEIQRQRPPGLGIVVPDVTDNSSQSCQPNFLQALPLLNGLCFCLDSGFWQIEAECEDSLLVSLLSEDGSTYSKIGFNVETVEYNNIGFTVWDVGAQDKVCDLSFQVS